LLLKRLDPAAIDALPASAWQRWAPAILAYHSAFSDDRADEEAHRELVRLAYRFAPEEALWALGILLEKENRRHQAIHLLPELTLCWDDRLSALLLLKAQDPSLAPAAVGSLLDELLDRGVAGARAYAASLLSLPLPTRRDARRRARAAAQALFAHTADAGWPVLKRVFWAVPEFGQEVVLGALPDMSRGQRSRWQHLSEDEEADLFLWMEERFPRAKDRDVSTGTLQTIEPRDEAAELRDKLLRHLSERGTRAAVDAILRIEQAHRGKDWISLARIHAQENALQGTRTLLSPKQVIALHPRAAGHAAPADWRADDGRLVGRCDVLLMTVTQVETQAVLGRAAMIAPRAHESVRGALKIYHDLGEIGGARVFAVQSEMGAKTQGGSISTTLRAIWELKPSLVLMVGIAFGMAPDRQPIGKILVSAQLQDYELARYGTDTTTGELTVVPRGDRITAPARTLNQVKTAMTTWDDGEYGGVDCCLMLSGDKLVDNTSFRDQLLKLFPEARGGEMEGAGVAAMAHEAKVDWLVVKAVCDWADGQKYQQKEQRQALAAQRVAAFVFHALERGVFAP
jgi:nucleoside phosphorylase